MADGSTASADSTHSGGGAADRSGSPAADPMAQLTETGGAGEAGETGRGAGKGAGEIVDPLDSLAGPAVPEAAVPEAAVPEAVVDDRPPAVRYPHLDLPAGYDPADGPGWAEGIGADGRPESELTVYRDAAKASPITGIDNIARDADGIDVLWENKSVQSDWQPGRWTARHIDKKVDNYLDARGHIPHYEGAELGFRFTEQLIDDPLRDAIVAAVERKAEETGVPIRIEWSTGEQVRFGG